MDSFSRRLCNIPMGTMCTVSDVDGEEAQKLHLFDLGFFKGSNVCPLYECYGGKTRAYAVKGTLVAIRAREAYCILTEEADNGK